MKHSCFGCLKYGCFETCLNSVAFSSTPEYFLVMVTSVSEWALPQKNIIFLDICENEQLEGPMYVSQLPVIFKKENLQVLVMVGYGGEFLAAVD